LSHGHLFHISVFFIYLKTFRRPGLMKSYSAHKPGGQVNHEKSQAQTSFCWPKQNNYNFSNKQKIHKPGRLLVWEFLQAIDWFYWPQALNHWLISKTAIPCGHCPLLKTVRPPSISCIFVDYCLMNINSTFQYF